MNRKHSKYKDLIQGQKKKFPSVTFINLSISALGVFDAESANFLKRLELMALDDSHVKFFIKKIISISGISSNYKRHIFMLYNNCMHFVIIFIFSIMSYIKEPIVN